MIELYVKDHCQNCNMFAPSVDTKYFGEKDGKEIWQTMITCKWDLRCESIIQHLREEIKRNEENQT